ncbi:o-methyltransferase [Colletotrichum plurivorum]|uniref:O-methyltransferase n=1 Tax=Colletotrichum plurivorum TaxID=2175906 RepID=A0A8H6KBF0_9PEZI|nr:o-methyltransferase [Colletotrichum plurivorum]
MQNLAEKILFATRPHMIDPMKRVFHIVDTLSIRLLIDWKVFDAIPMEEAVSYADLASKVDAEESIRRGPRHLHQDARVLRPLRLRRVMEAMGSVQLGPMVAASYDFGWVRGRVAEAEERDRVLFVDVGGGKGHVTKAVLAQNGFIPRRLAVLEDREEVVRAVAEAGEPGLEGVRLQGHDFHTEQPIKNALMYTICRYIHDYGEEVAVKMMRHLRDAMAPDSKLLIAECVMGDPPTSFETMMDFIMIDLGGKERTAKEWAELAARAGLRVENIHGAGREIQVVECVKV